MLICSVKPLIFAAATVGLIACIGSASYAASAISFSPLTGAVGLSQGVWNYYDAIQIAQRECNNPDCRVVILVKSGCAYLAIGDNNIYGFGTREKLAIKECAFQTSNCTKLYAVCNER
jgi:hypothetical protein